jgi:hypothetical protein
MTRATPRQQQRPYYRGRKQRSLGEMALHWSPYLAALIVPLALACLA